MQTQNSPNTIASRKRTLNGGWVERFRTAQQLDCWVPKLLPDGYIPQSPSRRRSICPTPKLCRRGLRDQGGTEWPTTSAELMARHLDLGFDVEYGLHTLHELNTNRLGNHGWMDRWRSKERIVDNDGQAWFCRDQREPSSD